MVQFLRHDTSPAIVSLDVIVVLFEQAKETHLPEAESSLRASSREPWRKIFLPKLWKKMSLRGVMSQKLDHSIGSPSRKAHLHGS